MTPLKRDTVLMLLPLTVILLGMWLIALISDSIHPFTRTFILTIVPLGLVLELYLLSKLR